MIKSPVLYLLLLLFFAYTTAILRKKYPCRLFNIIPTIVIVYMLSMLLCTANIWDLDSTAEIYETVKDPLTYAMVFAMLLPCSIKKVLRMSQKLLLTFFCAMLSIVVGFVSSYYFMEGFFGKNMWRAFAALCGSWIGGGSNFFALQSAFNANSVDSSYVLMINAVCFPLWIMACMLYINTKMSHPIQSSDSTPIKNPSNQKEDNLNPKNILILIICSLTASAVTQAITKAITCILPNADSSICGIIITSIFALIAALSPLGDIKESKQVGNMFLYPVIALLASRSSFFFSMDMIAGFGFGLLVLIIHAALMFAAKKLLRLDAASCAVASLANIGGPATAALIGNICSGNLTSIGILMGLLGYILGTPVGMLVGICMHQI